MNSEVLLSMAHFRINLAFLFYLAKFHINQNPTAK